MSRHDVFALTERQEQIVLLVAEGLSNQQIADRIFLSERTVRVHVSNILLKTGLNNRTEIALFVAHRNSSPPQEVLAAISRVLKAVRRHDTFGFLHDEIQTANQWLKQWSV